MAGHGGNIRELVDRCGCAPGELLDFSANLNPLGPPYYLRSVINEKINDLTQYPDSENRDLIQAIATAYSLKPEQIVAGNGTSELLFVLPRILSVIRAVIPVPAYIDYAVACSRTNLPVKKFFLEKSNDFKVDISTVEKYLQPGDVVILGQPNNPTGRMVDRAELLNLAGCHPDVFFIVDEAFAGFVQGYQSVACALDNIITLCSLTKIFAIPGLRLGFCAAHADICTRIKDALPPWSVNTLAQAVGVACLADQAYLERSRCFVTEKRTQLADALVFLPGLQVVNSSANYLLMRLDPHSMSAGKLSERLLLQERIAIRTCGNYEGLDDSYFRVAVRTTKENSRLLDGISRVLGHDSAKPQLPDGRIEAGNTVRARQKNDKKPAIMFLGTGSDVGKSVLVAALCRILLQDGLRVAPFKAQNMSLNSYVTRDGKEMGRAQVVQAQACRLDPDVRMNPILLKPSSDVGSQIIVNGRPVGNMKVADYVKYKPTAWKQACKAYDSLAADYDVLVLEGAGSPGEVNLKSHDIVNMRMAEYAKAPVLLVGDIDRGGVYASFMGHMTVMEQWERELMAGFVVNRFRGDSSLLDDAHAYIKERTGLPVLGVVPYLHDLGLPQEDSVSFKAGIYDCRRPDIPHVDIAFIDFPHVSNFTDIEPLLEEPDVLLRIVRNIDELGQPDAVILPGSKNVLEDLFYLQESGLKDAIAGFSKQGCEIVGICGGFQLLGRSLSDPHGLEGAIGSSGQGLGLLDMDTELAADKTLTRQTGVHKPSGKQVYGYEIHHGLSHGLGASLLHFEGGSSCGLASDDGRIWGSYLHGIFDSDPFRRWFINRLRKRKGLPAFAAKGASYNLEPAFDRLAATVRKSFDMEAIYRLLVV